MQKHKIKKLVLTMALINLLQSSNYALVKADTDKSYIFASENIITEQYGGDQNDFEDNFDSLINDNLIWEEVQKYFPVSSFDSYEEAKYFYQRYFEIIANCGCGYVAVANNIFNYFNNREDAFLETFNFPMYTLKDDKVDYNYELLILKLFNYVVLESNCSEYSKDDIINYFKKDFYQKKINLFLNDERYNVKLPSNFGKLSKSERAEYHQRKKEREQIFHELYEKWISAKNVYKNLGLPLDVSFGNIKGFLKKYHLKANVIYNSKVSIDYNSIVASDNFILYEIDTNGEIIDTVDHIESHYVYVTGFSSDGKIIVSSWGKKYYFDDKDSKWTDIVSLKIH